MPDALSKTVPIWCAVINLAIQLRRGIQWDTDLYLPASIVSSSERSQVESRVQAWAETLEVSIHDDYN
jgi:tRNA A64-2'-O-ribosylphosphate transferase